MRTVTIALLIVFIASVAALCKDASHPLQSGKKPGYITLQRSEFSLALRGDRGFTSVDSKNATVALAPGKYTMELLTLKKKDSSGREWTISSKRLNKPVLIREGKYTVLNYGEPLSVTVSKKGKEITLDMTGSFHESYAYVMMGGKRMDPPTFIIKDPSGKEIDRGQFKYG